MTKKSDTPAIRFKGFTDTWEQRKFFELYEKVSRKNDLTYGKDDIISVANMYFKEDSYITDESYLLTYNIFELGDIAFEGNKSKNYAHGRFVENTIGNGIVSHVFDVFKPIMKPYDLQFWKYAINNEQLMGGILLRSTKASTMMTNLVANDFLQETFLTPTYPEQQKIGAFFQQLDNLITLHQRKYDKLTNVKKSMLEKMFPKNGSNVPEIRFKGFTEAWEQRKLSDFGKATGGTSIESEFSEDGLYKVISIGSYSEDNIYRDQGIRVIDSDKTRSRVLNEGDLTMILNDKTASGNIIGRALLIEESGVYVYNQRTERIEIDHDNYDSLFIYEMLNAPAIRDKIIKQSQGNTQIYVNWPTISLTEYLVPQIEEQREIGKYFSELDNLITLHQCKCDKYSNIKKGMMSDLLTGKIRLV